MNRLNNNNSLDQNESQSFIDSIKNGSVDKKLSFIENLVTQTDIPTNFMRIKNGGNDDRIFYRVIDGKKQRREWLLFRNNCFFCVFCMCF